MRINDTEGRRRYSLDPGDFYVTREHDVVLSTLLGSCVAACLYDPLKNIVGMNHFLLANRQYARKSPNILESDVGRYGIHSMEVLINEMMKQGALKSRLKAKVFGGGNVLKNMSRACKDNSSCVGEVNSRFVVAYLNNESIPITASHLGGDHGRVIYFKSADHSVYMRRISHALDDRVARQEYSFWEHEIQEHDREEKVPEIQFW